MKRIIRTSLPLGIAGALLSFSGCRGKKSEKPPIHLNLNMDFQTKYLPQSENNFFSDGRAMRPKVPGTIAQGSLNEDTAVFQGKDENGNFVDSGPFRMSKEFLKRGQERYDIYCTPCHGLSGKGDGIVVEKGMLKPPSFHDDRIIAMPAGQIYDAIINGVRGNMPAYDYAIPLKDRWAIVAYVGALQLSQRAKLEHVPSDVATEKGWK